MIIPVSPVPVRIALETQTINNNGYVVHDINVAELIEKADSAQYELQLCYGTTSLYRSSVYQINKYTRSIPFFFMVGSDLFTATLSVGSNRCTFTKMSSGLSESQVRTIIQNELKNGVAEYASDVDHYEGCTITLPAVDNTIRAAGHLVAFEEGSSYSNSNVYESDFFHIPGDKWRYKSSSGDISVSDVTTEGVNTGIKIYDVDSNNFAVYVVWYENPDGCSIELGEYQPPSGG